MTDDATDLESFRQERGLSYRKLAELLGLSQGRLAMAYALGQMWPDAYRLEHIVEVTGGKVSVEAMHERRLQWLRERDAKQSAEDADDDGRRNRNDDALKCSPAGP